jgi:DNA-binding NarL/FixJ family response regulator
MGQAALELECVETDAFAESKPDYVTLFSLRARDKVRALLLDFDPFDRQAVFAAASRCHQLDIAVTPCSSVETARTALESASFDIIFVEYWLGMDTSIPFIHEIAGRCLALCVVVTNLNEPDIRRLAFRAGAQGFLAKDALSPQAIESVTLTVLRANDRIL